MPKVLLIIRDIVTSQLVFYLFNLGMTQLIYHLFNKNGDGLKFHIAFSMEIFVIVVHSFLTVPDCWGRVHGSVFEKDIVKI